MIGFFHIGKERVEEMFGACQRRSAELPKAALRLFSSQRECLGNVVMAAPAVENSAAVEYVSSNQASTSGIGFNVALEEFYSGSDAEYVQRLRDFLV